VNAPAVASTEKMVERRETRFSLTPTKFTMEWGADSHVREFLPASNGSRGHGCPRSVFGLTGSSNHTLLTLAFDSRLSTLAPRLYMLASCEWRSKSGP